VSDGHGRQVTHPSPKILESREELIMPAQSDLTGHVALVSGANHGIGAATARLLARHGAAVLITYLRTDTSSQYPEAYRAHRRLSGHDVAANIVREGGKARATEADLLDGSVIPHLFAEAEQAFGPVDILINNATGHCAHDSFAARRAPGRRSSDTLTADLFDKTFGVDARAGALMIAEFARRHIERQASWGRIIGLTSGGPMGFPGELSYGAAKAALENYTMAASVELGRLGVTANMVYPPVTDTGWVTDEVREFVSHSDDHIHVARPEDVAGAILMLCSPRASMITGNVLRMR
jgi:3-oxoacyl-[acyl-carrier protein] reductase